MSLVRIAARIAAVEALKGRTIIGSNVLDSEIGSLQVDGDGTIRTDEDRPFLTVYTDAATTRDVDTALRAMVVNGATEIVFEAGITAAMTETDPVTDESVVVGIGVPATDRALEFFLDMVIRQVGDTLTDPENEWAQIFQSFIISVSNVSRARTSNDSDGVRLGGHQLRLNVSLLADPVKGEPLKPTSALAKFFAKAATLGDAAVLAQIDMMQAQIAGEALSLELIQRRFGLISEEAGAMLLSNTGVPS
jgi:hypothetical protein